MQAFVHKPFVRGKNHRLEMIPKKRRKWTPFLPWFDDAHLEVLGLWLTDPWKKATVSTDPWIKKSFWTAWTSGFLKEMFAHLDFRLITGTSCQKKLSCEAGRHFKKGEREGQSLLLFLSASKKNRKTIENYIYRVFPSPNFHTPSHDPLKIFR